MSTVRPAVVEGMISGLAGEVSAVECHVIVADSTADERNAAGEILSKMAKERAAAAPLAWAFVQMLPRDARAHHRRHRRPTLAELGAVPDKTLGDVLKTEPAARVAEIALPADRP